MATLIDEERVSNEEFDQLDQAEETAQAPEPEQNEVDDDIPEKYRGKSFKDLVEMHRNAEKLLGKHSSEVGELRRVVDDFIHANSQQAPKQQEPEEEVDFYTDPEKAVSKSIASHPDVQEARQYAQQARQATAVQTIQSKHPDMQQIIADPKFAEWVQGSRVRTQLLVQADQYDVEAADELFSTWKQLNQTAQQVATADQAARKQAVNKASTGAARGSTEQRGKKKYRRADIIKLIKEDPARYDALQPEIMQAYAEGRII